MLAFTRSDRHDFGGPFCSYLPTFAYLSSWREGIMIRDFLKSPPPPPPPPPSLEGGCLYTKGDLFYQR